MRISVAVSGEEVSPKEQSTSGKRNRKHIGLKASLCVYNVYEHCSRVRSCTRQARQISAIEQADIVKRQCNAAQARDAADYDAIWEDAIACFAMPRMDEAIKAYKDGHGGMRGHPIAHAVRARLCKQGYPLPVLVGPDALDKVFCAQTTRIRGPILSLASLLMALLVSCSRDSSATASFAISTESRDGPASSSTRTGQRRRFLASETRRRREICWSRPQTRSCSRALSQFSLAFVLSPSCRTRIRLQESSWYTSSWVSSPLLKATRCRSISFTGPSSPST